MGVYINPGNIGFAEINDSDYVDKTMLIDKINKTIGTTKSLHVSAVPGDSENHMRQKC